MRTKVARSCSLATVIVAIVSVLMEHARGASFDFSSVVGIGTKPLPPGEKRIFGPVSTFSFVLGGTTYGNQNDTIDLTVPQSYVPPAFGTNIPVTAKNTSFHLINEKGSDGRIGFRLFSFIEAGVKMRGSKDASLQLTGTQDNPYSPEYQTLWGGYSIGDYAAIGAASIDGSRHKYGWYAQIQTPDINLTRNLAIVPFFYKSSDMKYDVVFRSGYHRFGLAFSPEYKSANIGTINQTYSRAGLILKYRFDEVLNMGVQAYSEQGGNSFSATSDGNLFKVGYSTPESATKIGYGVLFQLVF